MDFTDIAHKSNVAPSTLREINQATPKATPSPILRIWVRLAVKVASNLTSKDLVQRYLWRAALFEKELLKRGELVAFPSDVQKDGGLQYPPLMPPLMPPLLPPVPVPTALNKLRQCEHGIFFLSCMEICQCGHMCGRHYLINGQQASCDKCAVCRKFVPIPDLDADLDPSLYD